MIKQNKEESSGDPQIILDPTDAALCRIYGAALTSCILNNPGSADQAITKVVKIPDSNEEDWKINTEVGEDLHLRQNPVLVLGILEELRNKLDIERDKASEDAQKNLIEVAHAIEELSTNISGAYISTEQNLAKRQRVFLKKQNRNISMQQNTDEEILDKFEDSLEMAADLVSMLTLSKNVAGDFVAEATETFINEMPNLAKSNSNMARIRGAESRAQNIVSARGSL